MSQFAVYVIIVSFLFFINQYYHIIIVIKYFLFQILSKWEELTGTPLTERFHPDSDVKTKQIDETSTVGEKSLVNEKTSIKNTFIGANCTIENKVRLTNCILMNNVTIKEG